MSDVLEAPPVYVTAHTYLDNDEDSPKVQDHKDGKSSDPASPTTSEPESDQKPQPTVNGTQTYTIPEPVKEDHGAAVAPIGNVEENSYNSHVDPVIHHDEDLQQQQQQLPKMAAPVLPAGVDRRQSSAPSNKSPTTSPMGTPTTSNNNNNNTNSSTNFLGVKTRGRVGTIGAYGGRRSPSLIDPNTTSSTVSSSQLPCAPEVSAPRVLRPQYDVSIKARRMSLKRGGGAPPSTTTNGTSTPQISTPRTGNMPRRRQQPTTTTPTVTSLAVPQQEAYNAPVDMLGVPSTLDTREEGRKGGGTTIPEMVVGSMPATSSEDDEDDGAIGGIVLDATVADWRSSNASSILGEEEDEKGKDGLLDASPQGGGEWKRAPVFNLSTGGNNNINRSINSNTYGSCSFGGGGLLGDPSGSFGSGNYISSLSVNQIIEKYRHSITNVPTRDYATFAEPRLLQLQQLLEGEYSDVVEGAIASYTALRNGWAGGGEQQDGGDSDTSSLDTPLGPTTRSVTKRHKKTWGVRACGSVSTSGNDESIIPPLPPSISPIRMSATSNHHQRVTPKTRTVSSPLALEGATTAITTITSNSNDRAFTEGGSRTLTYHSSHRTSSNNPQQQPDQQYVNHGPKGVPLSCVTCKRAIIVAPPVITASRPTTAEYVPLQQDTEAPQIDLFSEDVATVSADANLLEFTVRGDVKAPQSPSVRYGVSSRIAEGPRSLVQQHLKAAKSTQALRQSHQHRRVGVNSAGTSRHLFYDSSNVSLQSQSGSIMFFDNDVIGFTPTNATAIPNPIYHWQKEQRLQQTRLAMNLPSAVSGLFQRHQVVGVIRKLMDGRSTSSANTTTPTPQHRNGVKSRKFGVPTNTSLLYALRQYTSLDERGAMGLIEDLKREANQRNAASVEMNRTLSLEKPSTPTTSKRDGDGIGLAMSDDERSELQVTTTSQQHQQSSTAIVEGEDELVPLDTQSPFELIFSGLDGSELYPSSVQLELTQINKQLLKLATSGNLTLAPPPPSESNNTLTSPPSTNNNGSPMGRTASHRSSGTSTPITRTLSSDRGGGNPRRNTFTRPSVRRLLWNLHLRRSNTVKHSAMVVNAIREECIARYTSDVATHKLPFHQVLLEGASVPWGAICQLIEQGFTIESAPLHQHLVERRRYQATKEQEVLQREAALHDLIKGTDGGGRRLSIQATNGYSATPPSVVLGHHLLVSNNHMPSFDTLNHSAFGSSPKMTRSKSATTTANTYPNATAASLRQHVLSVYEEDMQRPTFLKTLKLVRENERREAAEAATQEQQQSKGGPPAVPPKSPRSADDYDLIRTEASTYLAADDAATPAAMRHQRRRSRHVSYHGEEDPADVSTLSRQNTYGGIQQQDAEIAERENILKRRVEAIPPPASASCASTVLPYASSVYTSGYSPLRSTHLDELLLPASTLRQFTQPSLESIGSLGSVEEVLLELTKVSTDSNNESTESQLSLADRVTSVLVERIVSTSAPRAVFNFANELIQAIWTARQELLYQVAASPPSHPDGHQGHQYRNRYDPALISTTIRQFLESRDLLGDLALSTGSAGGDAFSHGTAYRYLRNTYYYAKARDDSITGKSNNSMSGIDPSDVYASQFSLTGSIASSNAGSGAPGSFGCGGLAGALHKTLVAAIPTKDEIHREKMEALHRAADMKVVRSPSTPPISPTQSSSPHDNCSTKGVFPLPPPPMVDGSGGASLSPALLERLPALFLSTQLPSARWALATWEEAHRGVAEASWILDHHHSATRMKRDYAKRRSSTSTNNNNTLPTTITVISPPITVVECASVQQQHRRLMTLFECLTEITQAQGLHPTRLVPLDFATKDDDESTNNDNQNRSLTDQFAELAVPPFKSLQIAVTRVMGLEKMDGEAGRGFACASGCSIGEDGAQPVNYSVELPLCTPCLADRASSLQSTILGCNKEIRNLSRFIDQGDDGAPRSRREPKHQQQPTGDKTDYNDKPAPDNTNNEEEEFLMMLLGAGESGGMYNTNDYDETPKQPDPSTTPDNGLNIDTSNSVSAKQQDDLSALQAEVALLDAELQAMCLEEALMLADEEAYHSRSVRAAQRSDKLSQEAAETQNAKAALLSTRLIGLRSTGLLRRMFDVQVDNAIGIINGVRIGRLSPTFFAPANPSTASLSRRNLSGLSPSSGDYCTVMDILSKPVSNEEINIGCGYLLELVALLASLSKAHLSQNVVLIPAGSASVIELHPPVGKKGKKETFDLFINTKFFVWKTFGSAWVVLAACVQDIVNAYERKALKLKQRVLDLRQREETHGSTPITSPTASLPSLVVPTLPALPVQKDLVGGYSIKYNSTPDEDWTTAVRHLLTLLQWCIMIEDLSAETEILASA